MLVDEINTATHMEYRNGTFVSLIEDNACARTVLTFMVQSVCQSYKDVVSSVSVEKLDTSTLHCWFDKAMKFLDKIFLKIAVFVDNHFCKR